MSKVTIQDLEKVQNPLKEAGYDYCLELEDGKILITNPSDIESSEIGTRFSTFLFAWVNPRRLGRIFESSGGFILPNSNLKAPDISFVRASKLKQSIRYFAKVVPDLVVEIKSQSDRIKPLEEKIKMFLSMCAEVGILIDSDEKTVTIYRNTENLTILKNGDILTIPELFPGWELPITEIWPLEFDEE